MKENGLTINEKVKHIHSMCNNKLLKALWGLKSVMVISVSLLAVSIFCSLQFQFCSLQFQFRSWLTVKATFIENFKSPTRKPFDKFFT